MGLKKIMFVCMVFLYYGLHAQENFTDFEHFTVSNGLPSQTTYHTFQDSKGFLWVATDAGVSRFDGKNFTNFTTNDGLGDNEVISVFEDRKGRIWCTPFSAKISYYYNGKFYTDENDALLKKIPERGQFIYPVEDNYNNLYILIRGKEIIKIDTNDAVTIYPFGAFAEKDDFPEALYTGQAGKKIYYITAKGNIYIIEGKQPQKISSIHKVTNNCQIISYFQNNINTQDMIFSCGADIFVLNDTTATRLLTLSEMGTESWNRIVMDKYRNLWISNLKKNTFLYRCINGKYQPAISILGGIFTLPYTDEENNIWFCTGNQGLYKISYKKLYTNIALPFTDKLLQKNILASHIDAKGSLWIGYGNGHISHIAGETVKHYNLNYGSRTYNRILQIKSDAEGNIWCVTDETCVVLKKHGDSYKAEHLKDKEGLLLQLPLKGVNFDKNGQAYLVTPFSIDRVDITTMQFLESVVTRRDSRIYSCFFDSKGCCYVSSINGLECLENGKLQNITVQTNTQNARVQHFAENPAGVIFLATYSHGLVAIQNKREIARLGTAGGLAGVICRRVYLKNDTVYITTNGGITVAVLANNKFNVIKNLGVLDGLHSIDVNDISFSGNVLYAATSHGLSAIQINTGQLPAAQPPHISILSFKVNETPYPTFAPIRFAYGRQRIRVEFIAPAMDYPGLVKYRYRLNNHSEWNITSANLLEFNDLPHGDFSIQIQAKKYNSDWSVTQEIKFTITPPFYSTWWFRLLVVVFSGLCLYAVIRYRLTKRFREQLAELRQKEAIEKERNRIAADIHDDMGAELTNIVLLSRVIKHSPEVETPFTDMLNRLETSANEAINKMNEVIWTLNVSNDTLHNLAAYLRNYINRLMEEYRLEGSVTIDDSLFVDHPIKADLSRNIFLIIKESLHNVVKHSGANSIEIVIVLMSNTLLHLTISDNGKGFDALETTHGNGLKNIRKRAHAMQGTVDIVSRRGAGCIVHVTIPL